MFANGVLFDSLIRRDCYAVMYFRTRTDDLCDDGGHSVVRYSHRGPMSVPEAIRFLSGLRAAATSFPELVDTAHNPMLFVVPPIEDLEKEYPHAPQTEEFCREYGKLLESRGRVMRYAYDLDGNRHVASDAFLQQLSGQTSGEELLAKTKGMC